MKQITAFIKPHRVDDVMVPLRKITRLSGVSASDVRGFGRGRGRTREEGDHGDMEGFVAHTRLEIVCATDLVDEVCAAIVSAAHTGLRGDGKIYVSDVEDAVRISTGERGEAAA